MSPLLFLMYVGRRVLIIGSTLPWYEAICVDAGAAECWTLEYNRLSWDHPQLHTVQVADFEDSVKHGRVPNSNPNPKP